MVTHRRIERPTAAAQLWAMALLIVLGVLPGKPAAAADRVGGGFALERLDLRFAGGEKVKVLAAGGSLRAEAEITFRGAGQLGGAWEIADPTTTSGSPQFRSLELVSRMLAMGHREVLASPPLPTGSTGIYLLRLRITQPAAGGDLPALRYFVGAASQDSAAAKAALPTTIAARGPAAGSPAETLKFSWEPVAGSIAYQLEIYAKDEKAPSGADGDETSYIVELPSPLGRPPVTGVMVPGIQAEVSLGAIQSGKLAAGTTYLWRVVAIGKDGKALRESPLQELVR